MDMAAIPFLKVRTAPFTREETWAAASLESRISQIFPKEAQMHKSQKLDCQKAVPVPEKDLRFAMGRVDAYQHVDNPGQTPMKDGNP
jgi:hypothetical protein